jgi:hypothetical protein
MDPETTMPHKFLPVTTLLVTITIVFFLVFNKYVSATLANIPGLGLVSGLFAAAGFYVSLFKCLLWGYNRFLRDRFEPKEAITGEWFYTLTIKGKEDRPRYGICRIERHRDDVIAHGMHYSVEQRKFTSRFTADHIVIDGSVVNIIYTSVGVDEDIFMRRGVYFLASEGLPPMRMYGIWTDVVPNTNAGDIIMERRDTRTDQVLQSVGYPLQSLEATGVVSASIPT